jgi:hypothetical protein
MANFFQHVYLACCGDCYRLLKVLRVFLCFFLVWRLPPPLFGGLGGRGILPTLRRGTGARGSGTGAFGGLGLFALSFPLGRGFVGLLFAILLYITIFSTLSYKKMPRLTRKHKKVRCAIKQICPCSPDVGDCPKCCRRRKQTKRATRKA